MKTPDKTKRALVTCTELVMPKEVQHQAMLDALACIQQLETANTELLTRCERLERERDAAVADLKEEMGCKRCSKYTWTEEYVSTDCLDCINKCNWEWRGVKEE